MRFAICLLLTCAFGALVPGRCLATGSTWNPRLFGSARQPSLAWIGGDAARLGTSDTLDLQVRLGSDLPLTKADWQIELPPGLIFLAGELHGSGLNPGPQVNWKNTHALVRCEHWGDFKVAFTIRAAADSANWSSYEQVLAVHVTPDSFTSEVLRGQRQQSIVVDGLHFRQQLLRLIPLDPGEDERIGPEVDAKVYQQPAPAIHREAVVRAAEAVDDSTTEVPVWVVVDRNSRVKATDPATGPAAEAARKWTFEPAISLGRPITMLYLIKVPVVAATGR